MIISRRT